MDWRDQMITDLRAIGVVAESCLGCGSLNCFSCPAGSATVVVHSMLAPEAAERLKKLRAERRALEASERS